MAPKSGPEEGLVQPSDLSFDTVCSLFEILTNKNNPKVRSWAARRKIVDRFISTCIVRESGDAFAVFRLVLPNVNNEEGSWMGKGMG